MPEKTGRIKVKMPSRGRTGEIEIECQTRTVEIPVGPFRYTNGPKKGQFVPIRHVEKNFAALTKAVQKATKKKAKVEA